MTKKILSAAALTLLLAVPAPAAELAGFGAYWSTSDAEDALGVGARLRAGYFELRATYFSDVTADTDPEPADFEVSAVPLEAGLAYRFPVRGGTIVNPYVGAGLGYYLLDTSFGDIDDESGWYAVAGADFGGLAQGLGFLAEGMYRNVETSTFDLSGFAVNAGIVWRF